MSLDPNYASTGLSQGNKGLVLPDQSKVNVMFFSKPKLMPYESKERGAQVWKNIDMVRVRQPGEKDAIELEVHDGHKQRWPEAWKAYVEGRKAVPAGTPLTVLYPEGNEAAVMTLNSVGIFVVEQMADVADSVLQNIPFGGEMKTRARRYLETVQGSQGFNKMQAELDKSNARSNDLERRLADMQEQMEAMKTATPAPANGIDPNMLQAMIATTVAATQASQPRRGRPPKAAAA